MNVLHCSFKSFTQTCLTFLTIPSRLKTLLFEDGLKTLSFKARKPPILMTICMNVLEMVENVHGYGHENGQVGNVHVIQDHRSRTSTVICQKCSSDLSFLPNGWDKMFSLASLKKKLIIIF